MASYEGASIESVRYRRAVLRSPRIHFQSGNNVIVHETKSYRIEYCPHITSVCPFALDYKEQRDTHVCLNNLGWFETKDSAVDYLNKHACWLRSQVSLRS